MVWHAVILDQQLLHESFAHLAHDLAHTSCARGELVGQQNKRQHGGARQLLRFDENKRNEPAGRGARVERDGVGDANAACHAGELASEEDLERCCTCRHLTHGATAPRVSQEFEFDTNGIAFPDGATYRAVQIGNGGAAGEWRVEFHRNLTTLTHLNQDPPTKSLTFAADTAKLFPAQHVPGADHAVLDIHEGPTGSPAFGTFLVIPEHSEETWQKYGVNTLRKREMEHSGGLMAKSGTGTKTNCCTCWYARPCAVVSIVWVLVASAECGRACVLCAAPWAPAFHARARSESARPRAWPTSLAWPAWRASLSSVAAAAAWRTSATSTTRIIASTTAAKLCCWSQST